MPLPPKLDKFSTATPIIAMFDFNDIEDGTGVITYYPFIGRGTAALDLMTNRIIASEISGIGKQFLTKTTIMEKTFEAGKFNMTRIVGGTAILKLPLDAAPDVSNDIITIDTTITLIKYDGSETEIVSITPLPEVTSSGVNLSKDDFIIQFEVPETVFEISTSVRLKVKVEMTKTSGSGTQCQGAVGFDPTGASFTSAGPGATASITDTQMYLNLPFRINE